MRACHDVMPSDRILKACEDLCSLHGERTPLAGTTPPKRQTRMRALPNVGSFLRLVLSDDAEKTVRFVGDSGGEINSVAQRKQIPQAVKLERRSSGEHERLDEHPLA